MRCWPVMAAGTFIAAGADTLPLRFRRARHLFGDAIRFLLVAIARRIDREFRLQTDGCGGAHRYPVEIMTEAGWRRGILPCCAIFGVCLRPVRCDLLAKRVLREWAAMQRCRRLRLALLRRVCAHKFS